MYQLFLDETGDHSLKVVDKQYPIFILAGCIFNEKYYKEVVVPKVEQLKLKYFKSPNIILHSYDIRKQKGVFGILTDKKKRNAFHRDMLRLINNLKFNIIASVIMKDELNKIKHKLKKIGNDPYEISFEFILERFMKFLENNRDSGELSFESRDDHSNIKLLNLYDKFKTRGSANIKAEEIKKKILGISFPDKKANLAGHQIADLVAHPIARHILNPEKENGFFKILLRKILRGKFNKMEGYGLKLFPKKGYTPKIIKGPRLS